MNFLKHMSPAGRAEVRQAKRIASKEEQARRTARARSALESAAKGKRQPRERDNGYLAWLRRAPCVACRAFHHVQTTPTRAAHVRMADASAGWSHTGKGEKPSDRRAAPLCDLCHTDGLEAQHRVGEGRFWAGLGIHPPSLCAALGAAYDDGVDPAEAVETILADIGPKPENPRG